MTKRFDGDGLDPFDIPEPICSEKNARAILEVLLAYTSVKLGTLTRRVVQLGLVPATAKQSEIYNIVTGKTFPELQRVDINGAVIGPYDFDLAFNKLASEQHAEYKINRGDDW